MLGVFTIVLFAAYLCFFFPMEHRKKEVEEKSPKYTAQMKKLWQIAQTSMKERKPFRAEKALLTILKFDEKNAAAYNRLGILYAKEQKYDEAVECFEIAQSLDNNPASIHNAGLIYFETGAYEKAEMAFSQAIALEGDVPARYIALAKTEEKLGRPKKAVEALENAYELDPKVATLRQILTIYESNGDEKAATATSARIEEQIAKETVVKRKKATSRALKAMRASSGATKLSSSSRARNAGVGRATTSRTRKVGLTSHSRMVVGGTAKEPKATSRAKIARVRASRKRTGL